VTKEEEVALADAYKRYAEACCSHDPDLAKVACEDLRCLIPKARESGVLSPDA
jgi:hypothetical protein